MVRVIGIDHLVIRVGDLERSKQFYNDVLGFLGFKLKYDLSDAAGWSNGQTLFWIGEADEEGKRHPHRIGNIGFHHYAFELARRQDVDALQDFLKEKHVTIVDPAAEYYSGGYYAVYFLDPDGLKLEAMFYPPEKPERAAAPSSSTRKKAARKKTASSARKKGATRKGAGRKAGAKRRAPGRKKAGTRRKR